MNIRWIRAYRLNTVKEPNAKYNPSAAQSHGDEFRLWRLTDRPGLQAWPSHVLQAPLWSSSGFFQTSDVTAHRKS